MPASKEIPVVIAQLAARRIREATEVLSRAFAEDPVLTFYFNDPRRRVRAYRAFFGDIIRSNLHFGHVYAATLAGRVVAVAVWRPPYDKAATLLERLRSFEAELTVRALFPRRARGLFEGFAATKSLHPIEPHWYLCFVGVDTDVQSREIGTRLLAPVLQAADRGGVLCYLETPFPQSHAYYARLGFKVASKSNPFVDAPPVWAMVRVPAILSNV